MYDVANRRGYLFDRLKNTKKTKKVVFPVNEMAQLNLNDEQAEEMINFFTTCVVSKQLEEIKEKMKQTAKYRQHRHQRKRNNFDAIPDFYFAAPELVRSHQTLNFRLHQANFFAHHALLYVLQISFDFELMYETTDPNALLSIWPTIETKAFVDFRIRIDESIFPFHDEQLIHMMTWLRLFSNKRIQLKTLLNSFIVISDVSLKFYRIPSEIFFNEIFVLLRT